MLAALARAPQHADPRCNPSAAARRRGAVLSRLRAQSVLSEAEYRRATEEALLPKQEACALRKSHHGELE